MGCLSLAVAAGAYWLTGWGSGTEPLHSATATLRGQEPAQVTLDDGATLLVPAGAAPEGTEVEAHRLSPDAAPDTPEELGSVRALYRFEVGRPLDAPVLIEVPIPLPERGGALEFRHHGPDGWSAVPVARHQGTAILWTGTTSEFAWLETDPAGHDEARRRLDLEDKLDHARANAPRLPGYLLDPEVFLDTPTDLWDSFASWASRVELTDRYEEMWLAGHLLDVLGRASLLEAGAALAGGSLDRAADLLALAQHQRLISHRALEGAAAVFGGDPQAAEQVAGLLREAWQGDPLDRAPLGNTATMSGLIRTGIEHLAADALADRGPVTSGELADTLTTALTEGLWFAELDGQSLMAWAADRPAVEIASFLTQLIDGVSLEDVARETLSRLGDEDPALRAPLLGGYALGAWIDQLAVSGWSPRPSRHPIQPVETPRWSRVPHDEAVFGGPGDQRMRSVTPLGKGLVAVGQDCSAFECVAAAWAAPDGAAWARIPHDRAVFGGPMPQRIAMWSVTSGGPGLVAVGWDCSDGGCAAAVWTSQDGVIWSRVPHDEEVFGGAGSQRMVAVAEAGPGVVAVGWDRPSPEADARAAVWTSPDGITWTRSPLQPGILSGPDDQVMWGVVGGGPGVVAVGYDGAVSGEDAHAAVWTSPDGITWSRVPHDESVFGGSRYQVMRSVVSLDGLLVAVGHDWSDDLDPTARIISAGAAVWTSRDGLAWSRVPHDRTVFSGPGDRVMWSVTSGGPGLVAVGLTGEPAAWVSPDGRSWSMTPIEGGEAGARLEMSAVTAGGPGLVAVGRECLPQGCQAMVWVAPAD